MRLTGLYIEGFGHFHHEEVKGISKNLSLFHGENEGGKSTLLAFIRSILYGFSTKRNDRSYPPLNGGKHGGRLFLQNEEGDAFILERFAGKKGGEAHLYTSAGEELPYKIYEDLIGGSNKELFSNMYAFSLDELQEFDTLKGEEMRQGFYSAATGTELKKLPAFEKKLKTEMENIYKPKGRNQKINALLKELAGTEEKIEDEEKNIASFSLLLNEKKELEKKEQETEEKIASLRKKLKECTARLEYFPLTEELNRLEAALAHFSEKVRQLTPEKEEKAKRFSEKLQQQEQRKKNLFQELCAYQEEEHHKDRQQLEDEEKSLTIIKNRMAESRSALFLSEEQEKEIRREWEKIKTSPFLSSSGRPEELLKEKITPVFLQSLADTREALRKTGKTMQEKRAERRRKLTIAGGILILCLTIVILFFSLSWWIIPAFSGILLLSLFLFQKRHVSELNKEYASLQQKWEELLFSCSLTPPQPGYDAESLISFIEEVLSLKEREQQNRQKREELTKEIQTLVTAVSPECSGQDAEKDAPLHRDAHLLKEGEEELEERFRNLRRAFEQVAVDEERKKRRNETKRAYEECEKELQQLQQEGKELLHSLLCADSNELKELLEEAEAYKGVKQKRDEAEERLSFREQTDNTLPLSQEELQQQKETIQEELKKAEEEQKENQRRKGRCEQKTETLATSDNLSLLKEQREACKEELRRLSRRWARSALASGFLQRAKKEFEREEQPKVLKCAGEILARLTGGKYRHIYLPLEEKSTPQLLCDDGSRKTLSDLSRGTREQLYLALRLAYACSAPDHIPLLPFVMDDILVNFDEKRAKATAAYLAELSQKRQILFFSCHFRIIEIFQSLHADAPLFQLASARIEKKE